MSWSIPCLLGLPEWEQTMSVKDRKYWTQRCFIKVCVCCGKEEVLHYLLPEKKENFDL